MSLVCRRWHIQMRKPSAMKFVSSSQRFRAAHFTPAKMLSVLRQGGARFELLYGWHTGCPMTAPLLKTVARACKRLQSLNLERSQCDDKMLAVFPLYYKYLRILRFGGTARLRSLTPFLRLHFLNTLTFTEEAYSFKMTHGMLQTLAALPLLSSLRVLSSSIVFGDAELRILEPLSCRLQVFRFSIAPEATGDSLPKFT
jgi:hypothetical protein